MLFRERKKNSEYHSFRMFFVRSRIECSCSLRSRLAIVLAGRLVSFKGEEQDGEAFDPWGLLTGSFSITGGGCDRSRVG